MEDRLIIDGLVVFANHGVYEEENKLGQKFEVSAQMELSTRRAGKTDELDQTVNYGEVCRFIEGFMKKHTFRLIEAVAEQLCEAILLQYPLVRRIRLAVRKPWAPVKLPLRTVAVEIDRGWHKAWIGMGSNQGDRQAFLDQAVEAIREMRECRGVRVSEYMETKAWGMENQPDFLNGALALETLLPPEELLARLLEIELTNGRKREEHWGPRTLDLDLLFYDDLVMEEDDLCLPHRWMHQRAFVLEPLSQIAPYKRHPVYGKTVQEMLEDIKNVQRQM